MKHFLLYKPLMAAGLVIGLAMSPIPSWASDHGGGGDSSSGDSGGDGKDRSNSNSNTEQDEAPTGFQPRKIIPQTDRGGVRAAAPTAAMKAPAMTAMGLPLNALINMYVKAFGQPPSPPVTTQQVHNWISGGFSRAGNLASWAGTPKPTRDAIVAAVRDAINKGATPPKPPPPPPPKPPKPPKPPVVTPGTTGTGTTTTGTTGTGTTTTGTTGTGTTTTGTTGTGTTTTGTTGTGTTTTGTTGTGTTTTGTTGTGTTTTGTTGTGTTTTGTTGTGTTTTGTTGTGTTTTGTTGTGTTTTGTTGTGTTTTGTTGTGTTTTGTTGTGTTTVATAPPAKPPGKKPPPGLTGKQLVSWYNQNKNDMDKEDRRALAEFMRDNPLGDEPGGYMEGFVDWVRDKAGETGLDAVDATLVGLDEAGKFADTVLSFTPGVGTVQQMVTGGARSFADAYAETLANGGTQEDALRDGLVGGIVSGGLTGVMDKGLGKITSFADKINDAAQAGKKAVKTAKTAKVMSKYKGKMGKIDAEQIGDLVGAKTPTAKAVLAEHMAAVRGVQADAMAARAKSQAAQGLAAVGATKTINTAAGQVSGEAGKAAAGMSRGDGGTKK